MHYGNNSHLYRQEKTTGTEMRPAIVSGIVSWDALLSHWTIFPLAPVTVPGIFAKVNPTQIPFRF